jgi:two-component system response regulator YesN
VAGYRAVLADDERWIVELLRTLIPWRRLGVAIAGEAQSGPSALELCRSTECHLLVTDVRMPGMDGLELIEAVRVELPRLQCIVVSGYDDFAYARRALRLGVLDYLLKPLDAAELERSVRRSLARLEVMRAEQDERQELYRRLKKLEALAADDAAGPGELAVTDWRIQRAVGYLEENLSRSPSLREVAEACHLSPSYFSEKFKETLGIGFGRYLAGVRKRRAAVLLANQELKCREIAEMLGFSNQNYFSRFFRREFGCSPEEYRRRPRRARLPREEG